MEKAAPIEIDLDEWEFLPDQPGFFTFGQEAGKSFFSNEPFFNPKGIIHIDVDYFDHQTQPSYLLKAGKEDPISQEQSVGKKPDDVQAKEFKDIGVMPPVIVQDRVVVPQVFSKKPKENEFTDIPMDSPKSNLKGGLVPETEMAPIPFKDEEEVYDDEFLKQNLDEKSVFAQEDVEEEEDHVAPHVKEKACCEGFGFTILGWRITGIGALCSLGAAAATLCILVLGGQKQQKQQQHHQNQKLQFQIYTDEKRIKQVVQQATRLNQALSAAMGAPMTSRAHISFGGCYDGL